MKRFFSRPYGFFVLAAVVCAATWLVIEPEDRWVSLGLAGLYLVLSVLFLVDELARGSSARPPPRSG